MGEYVTFRPYVFDRMGEDVNILYTHFKGYRSYVRTNRTSYPMRMFDICEMFWTYMMYADSLGNWEMVQENLKDKSALCWFLLKNNKAPHTYYTDYQTVLQRGNIAYKNLIEDDMEKHSPGSFVWYNMKNLGKAIENKPEVRNITDGYMNTCSVDGLSLFTHFCELYLMQYLKDDDIYSVHDYHDIWQEINGNVYGLIYPCKKIGVEHLEGFEDYLIRHGLI